MLRLFLLRHGKSSWKTPGLADFDRPLAPRGRKAAVAVAELLRERLWSPQRILCSSAVRTVQTLEHILPALANPLPEITYGRRLYDLMGEDYLDFIREEGGETPSLMLIGHNSATQSSALALCGMGAPDLLAAMEAGFPTAGLAVIDFTADHWADICEGSGALVDFRTPRGVV